MNACRRFQVTLTLSAALLAAAPLTVRADVVRLEILSRQPANDGRPVGTIGEFEILRGKIHGEIDPADPHNKDIQPGATTESGSTAGTNGTPCSGIPPITATTCSSTAASGTTGGTVGTTSRTC